MSFKSSDPLTFGLELEFQIVDRRTGMLSPSSTALWEALKAGDGTAQFALEATLATIELNSSVHRSADTMAEEVVGLTRRLRAVAEPMSLDIRGGGTQLTQFWNDRVLAPTPRSRELAERFGFLPKRFSTYGMHVHIGVPSGEDALRLGSALQALVPLFIAMSAASPFLQLQDTGFCASRPLEPLVYPHGGPMPRAANWAEFESVLAEIYATGLAASLKDIYWDVRPKPEFGTVEVRVFDTPLSVHKAVALAAFTRGCAALVLGGQLPLCEPRHTPSAERASRFLACRDGLAARICDPFGPGWLNARELAERLFEQIASQPLSASDARHVAALRQHLVQQQDSVRMREAAARWALVGATPEGLVSGLPAYSAVMCEALFEPLD